MKLLNLSLLAVALTVLLSPLAHAQVLKPIDPTQKADIGDKSVNLSTVQFETLSQPTRDLPGSSRVLPTAPLSKGNLSHPNVDTKNVDLESVEFSTISKPVLPQANFTAKRAAAGDKLSDESKKQLAHDKQKAPITERQIRPFTPGGMEELKKQLNTPH